MKLPRNGSCLVPHYGHNLYINAIMSPIVVRVYRPVTVRPRQRSALTLSDGSLICLTGTALLRAVVPASVHHARRPRFVPTQLVFRQRNTWIWPSTLRAIFLLRGGGRRAHHRVVGLATFGCDWPPNWRRRSICNLRRTGNSGSSFNDVRNLSPISWRIARLCE